MLSWYQGLLTRRPIVTKSVTAAIIMGSGDAVQQLVIERGSPNWTYHPQRTIRQGLFGLVFLGPLLHGWFGILDRLVASTATLGPVKKMLLDQAFCGPLINASFFIGMGLMEGKSTGEIKDKLSRDYLDTMLMNYKVWPAIQLVNFYLIPIQFRVLFANVGQFGWSIYLSQQANK